MEIVILGYGKMGKEVEVQAKNMGIKISKIIDLDSDLESMDFAEDEVIIEFTNSTGFIKNLEILSSKKANLVTGSTGWFSDMDLVKKTVLNNKMRFLYAPNFSIGVNLFWSILKYSAHLFDKFNEYDVYSREVHHKQKLDSPSGTAIKTAEVILSSMERKKKVVYNVDDVLKEDEFNLSSSRGGFVFGEHEVCFDSMQDVVKIEHIAKNRSGFARGAISSAIWLLETAPGFYCIDDFIKNRIGN